VKTILRAKRRVEVETPGVGLMYPKGHEIRVGQHDKLTEKGLHVCWGHGGYTLIPRDAFEIIEIHTETVTVETLVGEDGRWIETRKV
tara:strand:- start:6385 stop:6645 length:261 start_codon:yes stop_codon:yes gene_type:complete